MKKKCRSDLLDYKPMKEIATKLKKLIDDMFSEFFDLNNEIDKLGRSRKGMVEIFKEEYGITPSAYVNDLRYKEAERLLGNTDNEDLEIALV